MFITVYRKLSQDLFYFKRMNLIFRRHHRHIELLIALIFNRVAAFSGSKGWSNHMVIGAGE